MQPEAITATQITTHQPDNLKLFCACHSEMPRFIPVSEHGLIKAVMFNLGYLPGGDKAKITRSETTLAALEQVLNVLLAPKGVVSIIVYPGHAGGFREADAVKTWCLALSAQRYHVSCLSSDPTNPAAPSLLMIQV
ncbi:class I SAM-dependent methyltransferase [Methylocucumis oryzae]|uniref:class I SAM-dependent methyltransferase n=1 Tax=Methylocucumis oryzae TaxID=1632867 RepID=UPI0009E41B86